MKKFLVLLFVIPLLLGWGTFTMQSDSVVASGGGPGTEILYPVSDQQTAGWTSYNGGTFYDDVDEVTADGDTSYSTGSDRNFYLRFFVTTTGLTTENITSVTVYITAKGVGSTPAMDAVMRHISGATTYSQSAGTLVDGTYTTVSYTWNQNPHTSLDWEIVDLDDFAYGCVYVSPVSGVARVTQIRVEVTYA